MQQQEVMYYWSKDQFEQGSPGGMSFPCIKYDATY